MKICPQGSYHPERSVKVKDIFFYHVREHQGKPLYSLKVIRNVLRKTVFLSWENIFVLEIQGKIYFVKESQGKLYFFYQKPSIRRNELNHGKCSWPVFFLSGEVRE